MTTIAYDGKILAADTKITNIDGKFCGTMNKIVKLHNVKFGKYLLHAFAVSGSAYTFSVVGKWIEDGCKLDIDVAKAHQSLDELGDVIFLASTKEMICGTSQRTQCLLVCEHFPFYFEVTGNFAKGSGSAIALAAMSEGASAVKAIEIAAHVDLGTNRSITIATVNKD